MKRVRDADIAGGVRALLLAATGAALLCGAVEAACDAVQILVVHRLIFVSHDVAWMSPLAYLLFFVPLALLLAALSFLAGRRIRPAWSVGIFAGLTALCWLLPFAQISQYASGVLAIGIGLQAGRLTSTREPALGRALTRIAAVLAVLVTLAGITVRAWRHFAERHALAGLPPAAEGQPIGLFVVFDTVRRDHLGLYGYTRPTSPRLEALARRGVVFDRAITTAPWTLPSHASLFTGLPADSTGTDWRRPLGRAPRTLAEMFRDRGYLTGGFVGNLLYTSYESGLARGFAHFDDYPMSLQLVLLHASLGRTKLVARMMLAGSRLEMLQAVRAFSLAPSGAPADVFRPAGDVTDAFLDWQAHAVARPFFAFLNFFDAHGPYRTPDEFLKPFHGAQGLRIDRYDGAITYMDHELGRMMDSLQRRGVLARTFIVVVADHGDQFGEHHLVGHANSLYLPLLEVPLVMSFPGVVPEGGRVAPVVSLRDVAATLADVTGASPAQLAGISLADYWRGKTPPVTSLVVTTVNKTLSGDTALPNSKGAMLSRMDDRLHYIRDGKGAEELYAWRTDSLEADNLVHRPDMQADLERMRRGPVPRSLSWSARRDEVRRRG